MTDSLPKCLVNWVAAIGLETPFEDPKTEAFSKSRASNLSCRIIDEQDAVHLSQTVRGRQVLLVGLQERPTPEQLSRLERGLAGQRSSGSTKILNGTKVWRCGVKEWKVSDVVPSFHRIPLDEQTQALWDLANAMNFHRHIVSRKPVDAAGFMSERGARAVVTRSEYSLDRRVSRYDAILQLPHGMLSPRSLISLGKHSFFSGTVVPT